MKTRIKVATGLMVAVLSLLGSAQAYAAPVTETRYVCDSHQRLVVRRSADMASVQFIDRSYELRRHASSIGDKYISANAALIVDGPSAVFVAEDRLQLGTCREASIIALRR